MLPVIERNSDPLLFQQNEMMNICHENAMENPQIQEVEKKQRKRKYKIKEDFICVSCQSTEKNKLVTCYICKMKKCKSCIEKEKESQPPSIKKREQSSYICSKCFENETSKNRKKTTQEGLEYSDLPGMLLQYPKTISKKRKRTEDKAPSQLQSLEPLQNDNEMLDLDMLHNCVTPPSDFLEDATPKKPMKAYRHKKAFKKRRRGKIEFNERDIICHQCRKSNPFVEHFKCAKTECVNYYCARCIRKYPKEKYSICFSCQRICKCVACKAEIKRRNGLNHIEIDMEKLENKTNLVKIDDFVIVENDAPENESFVEDNIEQYSEKLTEKKDFLICQFCKIHKKEDLLVFKTLEEFLLSIRHYFDEICSNESWSSVDQLTNLIKDFNDYIINSQKNEKSKHYVFQSARCICKNCFSRELNVKNGFYSLLKIFGTSSNYPAGSGDVNKNLSKKSMKDGNTTNPIQSVDQSNKSANKKSDCILKKEKKEIRKIRNKADENLKHSDEFNLKNNKLSQMENTNEAREMEKARPLFSKSEDQNINECSNIIPSGNITIPSANPFIPGNFPFSNLLLQSGIQQIQTTSGEINPEMSFRKDQAQASANDSTCLKKENLQNQDAFNVTNIIMNIEQNKGNPNFHISMDKVLEELKTQFFSIQYYSLIQKLFISYIFKHMEMFTDNITKNQVLAEFVLNNLVSTMSKNVDNPENSQLIKEIIDQLGMLKTINNKALTLTNALNTNFDELKNNGYKIFKVIDPMQQSGTNNSTNENEMGKIMESIQNWASAGKGGMQTTSQDGTNVPFSIENIVNNISKMKNTLQTVNTAKSSNSTSNTITNSNSSNFLQSQGNLNPSSHQTQNTATTSSKPEVNQNNLISNSAQIPSVPSKPLQTVKAAVTSSGTINKKKETTTSVPKSANANAPTLTNRSIENAKITVNSSIFSTPANVTTSNNMNTNTNSEQNNVNKSNFNAQTINFNPNGSPANQTNMNNANMNNLLKFMGLLQNQNQNPNLMQNLLFNNSLYGGMFPQISMNPLLGYPGLGCMPTLNGNDLLSSLLMGAKLNNPGLGSMNPFGPQLLNMMNTMNPNPLSKPPHSSQNPLIGEENAREKKEENSEERDNNRK